MNKGMHEEWTPEQITILNQLKGRLPYDKIAKVLNNQYGTKRTKNAVTGKINRMKRL